MTIQTTTRFGAALLALATSVASAAETGISEEVPFVVTPDNVTLAMLEAAKVEASDYVIDLGSGDGRIVILAAKRFGARGLGIELVDDLLSRSRENARLAGVGERVEFRQQDLFETDLSRATVVTMYLLPEYNLKLRPAILALKPGTRIVSHDWDMGDWKPDRTVTVDAPDKPVGLEKKSRVHLWIVPAPVEGDWCATGRAAGTRLRIAQKYQELELRGEGAKGVGPAKGRVEGDFLRVGSRKSPELRMRLEGGRLRVTAAREKFAAWDGSAFERCAPDAGSTPPPSRGR